MLSTTIRKYLRANPDGATAAEIAQAIGKGADQTSAILTNMPDLYRDRWVRQGHQDVAVWVAVVVPEDCPRPERREKAKG